MNYRVLGRSSGLRVSEIALGTGLFLAAGVDDNNTHADLTDEDADRPLLVSVT